MESLVDERLEAMLGSALVLKSPAGVPALSLDGGETVTDPRGRKVPVGTSWEESEEDSSEVWDALTDEQREAVLDILAREDEVVSKKQESLAEIEASLEAFVNGSSRIGAELKKKIGKYTFYASWGILNVGFVKKGGHRVWLLPVSREDAVALAMGDSKVFYRTYSDRAEVRSVKGQNSRGGLLMRVTIKKSDIACVNISSLTTAFPANGKLSAVRSEELWISGLDREFTALELEAMAQRLIDCANKIRNGETEI